MKKNIKQQINALILTKMKRVKISGYWPDGTYTDYMMNPYHKNITEIAEKHNGKVHSIKNIGTDFIVNIETI